jgi:hypothetical protein
MASHFSSIGFTTDTIDDLQRLAETLAGRAEPVETAKGAYRRWRGSAGEEVWLQLDPAGSGVVGMNPHFEGRSSVRLRLLGTVQRQSETFMDGAFRASTVPPDEHSDHDAYPLVFDTPDFGAYANVGLPATAEAQIAAFAHDVTAFDSPEAFAAAETGFASRAFIPSGLFTPGGGAIDPPEAVAIVAGHVVHATERTNALTGLRYYAALVDTVGGTYDVVVDPTLLSGVPPLGGVLVGTFWLSGRLTSWSTEDRSWLGTLLRGG